MLERLVEYWLDSVNERTYQPAFVQMLVNAGHRVLHSTRHAPIEFGKDVVTIAPDGVPCAYQLKGNSGSRLTHAQFRNMLPQIQELVLQAIAHPSSPNVTHRSYLVTNGMVEEEVQRAVADLNRSWQQMGRPPDLLQIIDRGELLKRANELGAALWPFDIKNLNAFVELLAHDGRDEIPTGKLNVLLSKMYELESPDPLSAPRELERRATSAAILVAVALRNFGIQQNHFAIITAWLLYALYTIAACERAHIAITSTIQNSVEVARQAILDSLSDLADEAMARRHLIEGDWIPDGPFYHARVALIASLLSVYWLWNERERLAHTNIADVEQFLAMTPSEKCLWGEAAIPQILAHCWYIGKRTQGGAGQFLLTILSTLLKCQILSTGQPLPSPYFSLSSVVRWLHGMGSGIEDDDIGDANFRYSSYFAEGLLHLAVRANLKDDCKELWPSFTKVIQHYFEAEQPWQYCLIRSDRGVNHSIVPEPTGHWTDLQAIAADITTPKVPNALRGDPVLLLLFAIIAPYRATPDVVRYLGWCFSEIWNLPQPRPDG